LAAAAFAELRIAFALHLGQGGRRIALGQSHLTLQAWERFSELVRIADAQKNWSKKTYNNAVSVLRHAFAFGYRDFPYQANPASRLRGARLTYRDRPRVDPFRIQDAETLIEAIHKDWDEAQGNYDEFRFFTGMRPSEQIVLTIQDLDVEHGTLWVSKSKVHGVERGRRTLCAQGWKPAAEAGGQQIRTGH
jgi:integrase